MHRFFFLGLLCALLFSTIEMQAQDKPYRWTTGVGPTIRDFSGIPQQDVEKVNFSPAFHFQLGRALGSSFDAVLQTTFPAKSFSSMDDTVGLSEGDFHLRYKIANGYMLKESSPFAPYLYAGISGSLYDWQSPVVNASAPLGLGFRINRMGWGIDVHANYKVDLTDFRDYFTVHASLNLLLGGDEKVVPPPPDPDSDGDGIVDALDNCPNTFGLTELQGCPDRDGDGVSDNTDDCPDTPGVAELAGCPDLDTDKDGIENDVDACPDTPGLANLNGCPDRDDDNVADKDDSCPDEAGLPELNGCPDRDGDGIADQEDVCPDEAGVAELKGCPEIEEEVKEKLAFVTKYVQFETASAVLKTSSYAVLDTIVVILNDYPEYSLRASGHTDSQGEVNQNQLLSENRAKACVEYLIDKGISLDRLVYLGYGESRPIADNINRAGRAINRRVEFELFIK